MATLIQWIQQLMVFFILVTIIEMLLPNSTLKKHVRLAIGLVLILLFIQPIFSLFQIDLKGELNKALNTYSLENEQEQSIENLIEMQKKEIDQQVDAYTLEQAGEELIEMVQAPLQDEHGITMTNVTFEDVDQLTDLTKNKQGAKVIATLQESENEKGVVEEIQEISILQEKMSKNGKDHIDEEAIKTTIARSWELEIDQLQIEWVGGT